MINNPYGQMYTCIFDDEYQKQLKERALNNNGFEYTLRNYQELFLKEIIKVETINASNSNVMNSNI